MPPVSRVALHVLPKRNVARLMYSVFSFLQWSIKKNIFIKNNSFHFLITNSVIYNFLKRKENK